LYITEYKQSEFKQKAFGKKWYQRSKNHDRSYMQITSQTVVERGAQIEAQDNYRTTAVKA
jgi:hypothetical protein